MSFGNITVDVANHVAEVTVNRPDKLNALDNETISELIACFGDLDNRDDVGVIILTGAGERAFIAGADISVLAEQGVTDGRDNSCHGQQLTQLMEASCKIVIAAINGFALGGGLEVALACDLRFASDNARLGLPEVSLGIIPGYGATQRLPRVVGQGRALEMILTGDPIKADRAYEIGLVNAVFSQAELLDEVREVAAKIVSRGPTATGLAKEAIYRGATLPMADGLALEADLFGIISATDEMKEGMRAFLEKRDPTWKR